MNGPVRPTAPGAAFSDVSDTPGPSQRLPAACIGRRQDLILLTAWSGSPAHLGTQTSLGLLTGAAKN